MFNNDLSLKSKVDCVTDLVSPEIIPVSMIDVDRLPPMDMNLPLSDACPQCGGHNMKVGDYVCWGVCYGCYTQSEKFELWYQRG